VAANLWLSDGRAAMPRAHGGDRPTNSTLNLALGLLVGSPPQASAGHDVYPPGNEPLHDLPPPLLDFRSGWGWSDFQRFRRFTFPAYEWREVLAAWMVMVVLVSALTAWLSLRVPQDVPKFPTLIRMSTPTPAGTCSERDYANERC
jgi:hypothetical protein